MNDLAFKYYRKKEFDSAFIHALDFAESGSESHMTFVGELYSRGEGVAQSSIEAEKWFKKAAESESVYGLYAYGRFLAVSGDTQRAYSLLNNPKLKEFGPALFRIGHLVKEGDIVAKGNGYEVFFEKAAKCGHLISKAITLKIHAKREPSFVRKVSLWLSYFWVSIKTFIISLRSPSDDRVLY